MRFFATLAAFAFVAVPTVVATAKKSQPSSTPSTGLWCPETSNHGMSKIDTLCDNPPHRSSSFGCTYRGHSSSTSTIVCVYDVFTGKCNSADEACPKSALDLSKRSKRSASPAPAPAPAAPASHHFGRYSRP